MLLSWMNKEKERRKEEKLRQRKRKQIMIFHRRRTAKYPNEAHRKWKRTRTRTLAHNEFTLRMNKYFTKANRICHSSVIIKRTSHIHYTRTHQNRITGITKLHLFNESIGWIMIQGSTAIKPIHLFYTSYFFSLFQ